MNLQRSTKPEHKRRLNAGELADAGVSAALVFGLLGFGRLMGAGSLFAVIGAIVLAVLMARRGARTVMFAIAASTMLSVLLGGLGPIINSLIAGAFGFCGGLAIKREWGWWRTVGLNLLIAWPVRSGINVGLLALTTESRKLVFENIENQWTGLGNIVGGATSVMRSGLDLVGLSSGWLDAGGFFEGGGRVIGFILDWWYLFLPVFDLPFTFFAIWIVRRLGKRTLIGANRAMAVYNPPPLANPAEQPGPLPLTTSGTTVQRVGGPVLIESLNVDVGEGTHHAVIGRNGAGKSTLLDVLAGLLPAEGVGRPGSAGLGLPGGTTMIGQRPEGQVLAPRVIDDLRWGVGSIDVSQALEMVGLAGMEDRMTSDLSGGELQRLALAGALMRKPRLLLADEATAMLDPEGREMVGRLLAEARGNGTAIVSTSHLPEDLVGVDGTIRIGELENPGDPEPLPVIVGDDVLRIKGISHVYDQGAPWEHEALRDINLVVKSGELILVTGTNGSGKSTLARILAGLLRPTEGEVERVGGIKVAIAFQHARLQLLKPTVRQELESLAGHNADLTEVLTIFELVPLLDKRVDELSGGQQRRVLLAGLAARDPKVLVLDEPLAGLDSEARAQLTSIVDRIRQRGTAVIVVSHDSSWGHDRLDSQLVLHQGQMLDHLDYKAKNSRDAAEEDSSANQPGQGFSAEGGEN